MINNKCRRQFNECFVEIIQMRLAVKWEQDVSGFFTNIPQGANNYWVPTSPISQVAYRTTPSALNWIKFMFTSIRLWKFHIWILSLAWSLCCKDKSWRGEKKLVRHKKKQRTIPISKSTLKSCQEIFLWAFNGNLNFRGREKAFWVDTHFHSFIAKLIFPFSNLFFFTYRLLGVGAFSYNLRNPVRHPFTVSSWRRKMVSL